MYDSSVVIMNLDRMRNAKWSHQLQRFLQQSEAVKSDPSESVRLAMLIRIRVVFDARVFLIQANKQITRYIVL